MSGFENFWAIYGNLVLTLGTNALLALSIWLTLACGMHGHAMPAHHATPLAACWWRR